MKVIEVNSTNFNEEVLNSNTKVLVDFNAKWCGPCRMLKPVLEELSDKVDFKIVSIDVDESSDLARNYNVFSIPCLVLFENGNEVNRNIGFIQEEDIIKFVEGK